MIQFFRGLLHSVLSHAEIHLVNDVREAAKAIARTPQENLR
jgi:hypothetical protein